MDLISVIMPVYNAEKYLRQSIDSVLNQSYQNFELIIIDDGSTDHSLSIINSYADTRIKVISQNNSGPLLARKRGIDLSEGKYVAILDSDDVAHRNRLQRQIDFLKANPDFQFVGSNFIIIDSDGRKIYRNRMPQKFEAIRKLIYLGSPFCHSTILFDKKVFEKFNYEKEIPLAEDYNLWFKLLKEYKGENLPDYLLYYRVHEKNVSKLKSELLYNSTRSILDREFFILGFTAKYEAQVHYNLFWSSLDTSYPYSKLIAFKNWADSLVGILKLDKPEEKQIIQFYLFLRCCYSDNILSGLYLFFKSGYFNPLYFRYGFFYDNLKYRFRKLW